MNIGKQPFGLRFPHQFVHSHNIVKLMKDILGGKRIKMDASEPEILSFIFLAFFLVKTCIYFTHNATWLLTI